MARPIKCRHVARLPRALYFKPRGIPLRELTEVYLTVEGVEALRLVDHEGMDQGSAARQMNVSRHTLGRILTQARQVLARAITEGLAIRIEGGHFKVTRRKDRITKPSANRADKHSQHPVTNGSQTGEQTMKKIAISSEGPTMDDQVDPRFGRAGGFILVDLDTMETTYLDNGMSQTMAHGAGLQAAENVAAAGADVVLSDYVGPKAFTALTSVGIKVGQNCGNMTIREVVEKFKKGEIPVTDKPGA